MARWIFRAAFVASLCVITQARSEVSRDISHFVIDGAKIPCGTVIEVTGPCLWMTKFKKRKAIRGLRIDGRANQDEINFQLSTSPNTPARKELESLRPGTYYKVRGRLMDGRTVGPRKVLSLVVDRIEAVLAAPLRFTDFLNRSATFEGTAVPGGIVKTKDHQAQVDKLSAWPEGIEGKQVAVRGTLRAGQTGLHIEEPNWRLTDLNEQIGLDVCLDGYLYSSNSIWWFQYRSSKLYLTTGPGPKMKFDHENWGRRVRVSGKLVRQDRPSIEQIGWGSEDGLVPSFVVRAAKVEYLDDESLGDEQRDRIFATFHTIHDGVPDLLAERSMGRGAFTNPATATYYGNRNDYIIRRILNEASPATRDVLARRMNDSKLPAPLRLLYAAMLANLNDKRGRSFLITTIKEFRPETFLDALYCLGIFPELSSEWPGQIQSKTKIRWAEETLIAIMTDRRTVNIADYSGSPRPINASVAEAALIYSFDRIPRLLLSINSARGREVLVNYAVENAGTESYNVFLNVLLRSDVLLPVDDLLQLEPLTKKMRWEFRNAILSQFLRQKHYAAAERFLKDLEPFVGEVYRVFHDQMSAELTIVLRPYIKRLKGEAKEKLQMLIVLGERDPVPTIIKMLNDPKFKNKNRILNELWQLRDPRAVGPVARILREAPDDYFDVPYSSGYFGVYYGVKTIANSGASQAIHELIELLSIDLARFDNKTDRNGFQQIVAEHLIELTGESFGVDADAWRVWHRAQPVQEDQQ